MKIKRIEGLISRNDHSRKHEFLRSKVRKKSLRDKPRRDDFLFMSAYFFEVDSLRVFVIGLVMYDRTVRLSPIRSTCAVIPGRT